MASILYGPVQLSESVVFSTASSVFLRAPGQTVATELYFVRPNPGAEGDSGGLMRSVRQRRIPTCPSRHHTGMLSYEGVGSLLAIRGTITVIELVTVEALMSATMRSLEYREGQMGKAADVWGQTCRGANGIVVGKFDVQKMCIPIVLTFTDNHC